MRLGRIFAGLLVVAAASIGAGCGDGTPPPQAQGEVAGPVTKPRVAAFAREVQLRAGDFPHATVLPAKEGKEDEELADRFGDCSGSSLDPPIVAEFVSPNFVYTERDEWAGFTSGVKAMPTPYEANALVSLFNSPRGFSCLGRLLPVALKEGTSGDVELRGGSASRLTIPLPETKDAYGIRIAMTEIHAGREFRVFVDMIGFASGPNEIVLETIGTPTPVNQTVEAGLVATLYNRALSAGF